MKYTDASVKTTGKYKEKEIYELRLPLYMVNGVFCIV